MKILLTIFFSVLCCAITAAADMIKFSTADIEQEWGKLSVKRQTELTNSLLGAGLPSTGSIELKKIYTLTHDEEIGVKRTRIGLAIQEDLLGDRLFWIYLVNLETGKFKKLYRVGENAEVTKKQNKLEQATPRKPSD